MPHSSTQFLLNAWSIFLVCLWGFGLAEWSDAFSFVKPFFSDVFDYTRAWHTLAFVAASAAFFKLYAWFVHAVSRRLAQNSWQLIS